MYGTLQGIRSSALPIIVACALGVSACGDGEDDTTDATETPTAAAPPAPGGSTPSTPEEQATSDEPTSDEPTSAEQDSPPQIAGAAPAMATVGALYSFTPTASDPDGDALWFDVANAPAWLTLNPLTGELSGTPQDGDLGYYDGITITVTAGGLSESLAPFAVEAVAIGTQSVTLIWTPPTHNVDGSPLLDLAGYRISYGPATGYYTASIQIDNPGIATYVLEGLAPGEYYFAITAYTSTNLESAFSNEASAAL